jgi:hypothetical protein
MEVTIKGRLEQGNVKIFSDKGWSREILGLRDKGWSREI